MLPVATEDEKLESVKRTWSEIFKKYGYEEKINKLREFYPGIKSLYISFLHISEFNNEFASYLLAEPEFYLHAAEELIKQDIPLIRLSDSRRVNVRLVDVPARGALVEISDIRADHISKLLTVVGIIRKNTEVLPRLQNAVFQCQNGHTVIVPQARGRVEEPALCDRCAEEGFQKTKFKLLPNESEFVDVQKLEIQENPETMQGGTQPQRLIVIVEDDRTGELFPGDRVVVDGTLVAEQKRAGNVPLTEFNIYLYVNNFAKETKEAASLDITPEEEAEIKRLARSPDILDIFVQSIAPTIYGYEMIKKAMALQMFGGVRKTMKDGTIIRGDIHVLLVGDPGTAKSQLLRYMTEISPRGVMALGKGSSAAGLTAAAVRDDFGEGRWTLEAGVLVLANRGLASIDELDKMSQEDTSAMHEAMEQQSITISKAGIMATLKSQCSVLAAANPIFGRYDVNKDLTAQITLSPPLISRFDVIFKVLDRPNTNRDTSLAEHVLEAHLMGETYKAMERSESPSVVTDEEIKYVPRIPKELVRKYVAYAKEKIVPLLSREATDVIRDYYVQVRNRTKDSIQITPRQLESIIRLSEASAKMRLSTTVSYSDAILAKSIFEYFLSDVATHEGKIDFDVINTGMSKSQRSEMSVVLDMIRELSKSSGFADENEVVERCSAVGMTPEKVNEIIAKMKKEGQLYEPGRGKVKTS
jgi:replicative DNA helicase Mcm